MTAKNLSSCYLIISRITSHRAVVVYSPSATGLCIYYYLRLVAFNIGE